jgi:hypothetical protein
MIFMKSGVNWSGWALRLVAGLLAGGAIGYLAVFSLVVTLVGTGMGLILHGATKRNLRRDSGSA